MKCHNKKSPCECKFNVSTHGKCNPGQIVIDGSIPSQLNWSEISVPEIVKVPELKPDIEEIDKVFVNVCLDSIKLIETPFAYTLYEAPATDAVILTVTNLIEVFTLISLDALTLAFDAIIALLPAAPLVDAFEAAYDAFIAAFDALTVLIDEFVLLLENATCIGVSVLIDILNAVVAAANLVIDTLQALILAAQALVGAFQLLFPAIVGLVDALVAQINIIVDEVQDAIDAILLAIPLLVVQQYFVISSNEEGTCLSGRKIIVEGTLKQKVVYTGLVTEQSVHSAHCEIPFTSYIIPYAKFVGLEAEEVTVVVGPNQCDTVLAFPFDPDSEIIVDLCEEFCVNVYVEDIFAYLLDPRTIFKNITLFLKATPIGPCVN